MKGGSWKLDRRVAGLLAVLFWVGAAPAFGVPAATSTSLSMSSGTGQVTSGGSIAWGSELTLTATVTSGANAVTPGQVDFCDASAQYCSDIHLLGTAQLTASGTAVLNLRPGIGSHSYKAVFVGTPGAATACAASVSGALTLAVTGTVGPFSTSTTITQKTGSWGSYTLAAAVRETGGTLSPAGTVSFPDTSYANASLGSAALGAGTPGWTWVQSASPAVSGGGMQSVAVADFNGDGIPDEAVTSYNAGTVTILLGKADGTFAAGVAIPAGPSPTGVVAADLNGDGKEDLVVENFPGGTYTVGGLWVLLGNGDGTFTALAPYTAGVEYAGKILVADFNGDGIPDLAVSCGLSAQTLSILLGKGDGTFTAVTTTPVISGLFAAGDLNGDGKVDLVAGYSGYLKIYLGNGDGTFTDGPANSLTSEPAYIAIADMNGDGKPDLVVLNGSNVTGSDTINVLLGNGDGSFNVLPGDPLSQGVGGPMVIADFNGDGIPDVAAGIAYQSQSKVLLGKGDGTFAQSQPGPNLGSPLTVADFNGDGRPDLFSGAVVWLTEPTETATATVTGIAPQAAGEHWVAASYGGSLNYDSSLSATVLLWGQSPPTTTALAVTSGGSAVTSVAAGSAVILTATVTLGGGPVGSGQVEFCNASSAGCAGMNLLGTASLTSSGTAAFKFIPGPGAHSYRAIFLGNSIGATSSSNLAALAVTQTSTPVYPTVTTIAQSGTVGNYTLTATVTETGGMPGPGGSVSFLDTSYSNNVLATAALGSSTPGLSLQTSSTNTVASASSVNLAEGDFNGDGIPDIAVVNSNTMTVTILTGKGDGTFTASTVATLSSYTTGVVAGDFNGDGKLDLAVALIGSAYNVPGSVTILLGNGDGTFAVSPTSQAVSSYPSVVMEAADFNADGKLDLLVGDTSSARILFGNGDGTFTHTPITGLPATLAVADMNGDDIPDLIGIASGSSVAVYLGNGDGTFQQQGPTLPTVSQPLYALVNDFNGDGTPDIAVESINYGGVSVFLGSSSGAFTVVPGNSNLLLGAPVPFVAADFNRDGKVDLMTIPEVLLGNGDGTFMPTRIQTQIGSTGVGIAADFNIDGNPDLAVVTTGAVTVLLAQPTQTASATATGVSPSGPAPHLVDASYPGDSNYASSVSGTVSLNVQAATPVISAPSGTYTSLSTITLTDATPGTTIYYQGTGTLQTSGYVPYTGPIPVYGNGPASISAYASETGYLQSATVTANYTLNLPAAPAPVLSLVPGSYPVAQTLTISDSLPAAIIYYTTNGQVPTPSSSVYSAPLTVSTTETVAANARAAGYSTSTAAGATYFVGSNPLRFIYTIAGSFSFGYSGDDGPATRASLNDPFSTLVDAAGNVYISDTRNQVVRKVDAATGVITTIAGTGICGDTGDNGPATSAQLCLPMGLAFDSAGNLFVVDEGNDAVREIASGTGIITTYAGNAAATSLGDGGPATAAQLEAPRGIAFDSAGNLYIATGGNRIRKVAAGTGVITTVAGTGIPGYSGDNGLAVGAELRFPEGVAVDAANNLYIADTDNDIIRKVAAGAGIITTVAGSPSTYPVGGYSGDGGPATSARLWYPFAVTVDPSGNLYIADYLNKAIREVTAADGNISTIAGSPAGCTLAGGDGGPAVSSGVCYPTGVSVDAAGNLYVAAAGTSTIRKITAPTPPPAAAAAAPVFSVAEGTYANPQTVTISDATPGAEIYVTLDGKTVTTSAQGYHQPISVTGSVILQAMAVAPGYLPTAPISAPYTITAPPTAVVSTVAGTGISGATGAGGPATSADLGLVSGVAVDGNGNLYIADQFNEVVWMVSAGSGNISIVAGTLQRFGRSGDGGPATSAFLASPTHVAVDSAGNLYIADSGNGEIRKVDAQTGVISDYAGTGGYVANLGDGGPAVSAYLNNPQGLAFDSAGNLYIADEYDGRVRRVSASTGLISTVAGGSATTLGDGGLATAASVPDPIDVALDGKGNLYIAELAGRVRVVNAGTGVITTVAGNGNTGMSGDGGPATSAEIDPIGIAADPAGNLYIANLPNSVRMVPAGGGVIRTIAGSGFTGFSGDGGSATVAEFCSPQDVALDKAGSLYIADACNYRVRKVTFPPPAATPAFTVAAGIYASAQSVAITDATAGATIYYTVDGSTPNTGSTVYSGPITVSSTETLQAVAVAGGYTESAVATAAYTISSSNPVPVIAGASPAYSVAGSATFALTINGSAFTTASKIYWGATALSTQYVSQNQLTAQVPASDIASAGIGTVTVQTPGPGGGTSNSWQFEIDTVGSGAAAPVFGTSTASVNRGSSVTYSVTLPSSATNISVQCLNLPSGASCSYSPGTVTIATSSSTPAGTYQVIIVFTETLPGTAAALGVLPFFLLPLVTLRRKWGTGSVRLWACFGIVLLAGTILLGCGGGAGSSSSSPPPNPTHQVTSSGVVTLTVQ